MVAAQTSAKYDFSRSDESTKTKSATNDNNKSKSRAKAPVSAFAVFSFATCILMVVMTLFSYVQLTELSDSATQLKKQLTTIQEENQLLQIENNRKFSAETIKTEAVERLGMQKLDKSQITYLDMGAENRVEITDDAQLLRDSNVVAGIVNGFRWIVEYIN